MDITDVSSALSSLTTAATGSVAQQVSIEMLDQTMELTESMNTQLVQLMEQSVNPHIGGNLNLFI
ncbi:MAG: YjfB family protein [Lachnospiraceae bacterium]|nr:YjfB family protein [Lachnospiraceae bacterium]